MIDSIFNMVFFCAHRNTTFPLTPTRNDGPSPPVAARTGTYVVCLDCGKEFPYNWRELRIERPESEPVRKQAAQPVKFRKAANMLLEPLLRFLP